MVHLPQSMFYQHTNPFIGTSAVNFPEAKHHEVNYIQPKEIFHSESNPVLSDSIGPIIMKMSRQELGCWGNEVAMYRMSGSWFSTIPHVCSYEVVGKHHEVISNALFLP